MLHPPLCGWLPHVKASARKQHRAFTEHLFMGGFVWVSRKPVHEFDAAPRPLQHTSPVCRCAFEQHIKADVRGGERLHRSLPGSSSPNLPACSTGTPGPACTLACHAPATPVRPLSLVRRRCFAQGKTRCIPPLRMRKKKTACASAPERTRQSTRMCHHARPAPPQQRHALTILLHCTAEPRASG